jgi:hypothetical protein
VHAAILRVPIARPDAARLKEIRIDDFRKKLCGAAARSLSSGTESHFFTPWGAGVGVVSDDALN